MRPCRATCTGTAADHRGGGTALAHRHTTQSRASVSGAAASAAAHKITPICTRRCPASRAAADEQVGGSGAPAPRLPVTFRDEPRRLRATTHDRRLPMSRMLLRVPDGCGADRRLVIALRPQCNVSRTTAQARHDAGLSLDWASPVTWIWMAAQGATRLGRDRCRAATVEHIRTLELPGRVLRVAVRAGKPEWPPPCQPR
jgi:hypothetical protein